MPETLSQYFFTPTPEAISCELGGETVILDMQSGRYFALDAVGSRIWTWLETSRTLESVCQRVLEEYDVEPDTCRADVSKLLNQLIEHGLLRCGDER
jgi:Coenzyme PQQ synthesis protein D (PqqD)